MYLIVAMLPWLVIVAHYLALYEMLEYTIRNLIGNEDYEGDKLYATIMLFTVVYMIFSFVFEYLFMLTIGVWLLWRLYNNIALKKPSL